MKTKLFLIFISACLLSGCLPVAFVAGATAGGAVVYDNRGFKTIASDQKTSMQAESKINADPELKDQVHIVIATFNRIVLMTGQAPTPELRQKAYEIVSTLPNVKRIYNEVTVSEPTPMSVRSKDTWITTKVKTAMLAEKGLHSTQIKVVTENKVVYLMGYVSRSQANLAALVASKVSGVQKVVKLFEYPN